MTKNPILSAVTIGLALCLAGGAQAQTQLPGKVKFPAGLKWQTMAWVTFDSPTPSGTEQQRQLAKAIWGKEIESIPLNDFLKNGTKYPSQVLISGFESNALRYVFTSFAAGHAFYPACEDPPNSGAADTPTYSLCPMRVVVEEKGSGRKKHQDFLNYCHLHFDDPDAPAAKNHTEVAVTGNTAYFRVIQYGKHVPECDRAIRLQ
ncbi:hypothetical protein EII20_10830 [Comamonadaceae bacterium OH2545_COT-014]|nr:hypothetical protein EII20_10830 [Comamonadaceae bacterium OH2545_COT-014]